MIPTPVLIAFIASLVFALATLPLFSRLALRIGLVDLPDNSRKLHKSAIPMVGGLTVFSASIVVIFCTLGYYVDTLRFRPHDGLELTGLAVGALLLLLIGLADDLWVIRGRQKLLGQIVCCGVLIFCGFQFDKVVFAGMTINFGDLGFIVVLGWMLVAINSVNLLDGADGFAGTIGIVMSLALGVMAVYQGKIVDAVICVSLAGALIGFLRYNFPPAKVFLGDSGSMLIGFMLGAMAVRCAFKQSAAYAFFAPVALLAIPLLDTGAAIVRRRLMGRSIYTVDRGHLHHRLAKQGYGPRISLLWVALLCTMTAVGGVLALINRQSEYAIASIVIVVLVLFFARIFGLAEFRLVSNKAMSIGRSFIRGVDKNKTHVQSAVHVQGSRDWKEIWEQVCQFADEHELNELTLDLNVPWIHESFHATRRKAGVKKDSSAEWYALLPLVVDNRIFGRIEIAGSKDGKFTHHQVVNDLLKITADLEQTLHDLSSTPSTITNVAEIAAASDSTEANGSDTDDSLLSASNGRAEE